MLNTKRISKVNNRRLVAASFVLFSTVLFTSCIGVNRQFEEIKNKIMGNLSDDFETDVQFSVGPVLITVSSWFVSLSEENEYVDDMMREISSVQVGVYNRVKGSQINADFSVLQSINDEMTAKGWKYIIRSIENDEITAIYVSASQEKMLKQMYIINLNDEDLTIVEINGDLKKVIEYAIEEKNFDVKM